jgi:hypothetical protein
MRPFVGHDDSTVSIGHWIGCGLVNTAQCETGSKACMKNGNNRRLHPRPSIQI